MFDSLLRKTLVDEFELFTFGKLVGKPGKRLMRMPYRLLSILREIFRRVDDIEDSDGKGNWNCIEDVIGPFVTYIEAGRYQNQKNGWTKLTIEIARGRSCIKVNRNEFCSGLIQ